MQVNVHVTWLRIPTGRRRTSWLMIYKCGPGVEVGSTAHNSSLVVRVGLEPLTTGFQVWALATQPCCLHFGGKQQGNNLEHPFNFTILMYFFISKLMVTLAFQSNIFWPIWVTPRLVSFKISNYQAPTPFIGEFSLGCIHK